jgi:hypothetical protein
MDPAPPCLGCRRCTAVGPRCPQFPTRHDWLSSSWNHRPWTKLLSLNDPSSGLNYIRLKGKLNSITSLSLWIGFAKLLKKEVAPLCMILQIFLHQLLCRGAYGNGWCHLHLLQRFPHNNFWLIIACDARIYTMSISSRPWHSSYSTCYETKWAGLAGIGLVAAKKSTACNCTIRISSWPSCLSKSKLKGGCFVILQYCLVPVTDCYTCSWSGARKTQ